MNFQYFCTVRVALAMKSDANHNEFQCKSNETRGTSYANSMSSNEHPMQSDATSMKSDANPMSSNAHPMKSDINPMHWMSLDAIGVIARRSRQ